MKRQEFKAWVAIRFEGKSSNYRKDIVSRAKRIEKAFQEIDNDFTYEREYKKDGGKSFLDKFCVRGKGLIGTNIKLPVNTYQMAPLKSAASWYFRFLADKK